MILIDASVIAYAVGEPHHPLREPCRRILEAHGDGRLEVTTTVETLQAFLQLRLRHRSREDATSLTRELAAALRPIVTSRTDLERALVLMDQHPDLPPSRAVLAAVAIGHEAEALVSADPAFAAIPGLRWVDPGDPDAVLLLTAQLTPV